MRFLWRFLFNHIFESLVQFRVNRRKRWHELGFATLDIFLGKNCGFGGATCSLNIFGRFDQYWNVVYGWISKSKKKNQVWVVTLHFSTFKMLVFEILFDPLRNIETINSLDYKQKIGFVTKLLYGPLDFSTGSKKKNSAISSSLESTKSSRSLHENRLNFWKDNSPIFKHRLILFRVSVKTYKNTYLIKIVSTWPASPFSIETRCSTNMAIKNELTYSRSLASKKSQQHNTSCIGNSRPNKSRNHRTPYT